MNFLSKFKNVAMIVGGMTLASRDLPAQEMASVNPVPGARSTLVENKTSITAPTAAYSNPPATLKPKIGYGRASDAQDFSLENPAYLAISLSVGKEDSRSDKDHAKDVAYAFWKQGVPVAVFLEPADGKGIAAVIYDRGASVPLRSGLNKHGREDVHSGVELGDNINYFVDQYFKMRPDLKTQALSSLTPSPE